MQKALCSNTLKFAYQIYLFLRGDGRIRTSRMLRLGHYTGDATIHFEGKADEGRHEDLAAAREKS